MNAERSAILNRLLRAIALSEGEFALLLARCNAADVRDQIIAELRSRLESALYVWQATPETGAINLVDVLGEAPAGTQVACIVGLESSPQLNDILAIANNAREEFRSRFTFPVVVWVTDDVETKLRRRSPDLASWAAPPFVFALDRSELQAFLERDTADVLDWAFSGSSRAGTSQELAGLWQEWERSGESLPPELEAKIWLGFGIAAGSDETARSSLEHCLALVNSGALAIAAHYRLGLWWQQQGKQHRAEFLSHYDRAREQLQLAWGDGTDRPSAIGLVLGEVLLALALESGESARWQAVAEFAGQLAGLTAFVAGLQAEVAIARAEYATAQRESEQALQAGDADREGFYLLSLGRSLFGLGQAQGAIAPLERARELVLPEVDPDLHIRILRSLHQAYWAVGDYRQAFAVKCDWEAVETQYGFRAFIGAGRLRPQRRVGVSGEATTEDIAASGRQADIEALVERVKRSDCRLTVLHGPSGVGKSSLVQAGLVPALRKLTHQARSVVPVVVEKYEDWQAALATQLDGQDLLEQVEQRDAASVAAESGDLADRVISQLRENDRRYRITVLIFDQFEEFFFKHIDVPARQQFYRFLHDCLDVPYVWVFLSLREDYVHYLLECDRLANLTIINNDILNKNVRYYLGNFDRDRAKSVIQELTARSPYRLEPALIDRLVADLAADLGEVRPIELQVVGAQMLQGETKITTLAAYEALGVSPKQALVEQWLNQVVQDCGQENGELAQRVLYALTEEPEKRPVKTKTALQQDVHLLTPTLSPEERELGVAGDLDFVLKVPTGAGLVFEIPAQPEVCYQLIHDYLVPPIRQQFGVKLAQQLTEERQKRKLAEEKLRKQKQGFVWGISISAVIWGATATVLGVQAKWQESEALKQKKNAEEQTAIAQAQKQIAEEQKQKALQQKQIAENQTTIAKAKTTEANTQRDSAARARDAEKVAKDNAEKRRQEAELAKQNELAQRRIAEQKAEIARKAEAQAKELAERSRLDALNAQAVADSLYWKGLMDAEVFNLEEQVAVVEKAKGWQVKLTDLWGDKRLELLATLYRAAHISRETNRFHIPRETNRFVGLQAVFSPDGKSIFTGGGDSTAKLWSLDGRLLQTFQHKAPPVGSVAFSPDGKSTLTGGGDKTAKLWSLDGRLLHTFQHDSFVNSVAFSPNGQSILTNSDDMAKLWSLDGRLLHTFQHEASVWSVAFSPDGQSILTGSRDGTAKLWSLNKRLLQTFQHDSSVNSVAFSPNGQFILTGGGDAKLWSLDGRLLQTFQHNSYVDSVAFSPDGQSILTSSVVADYGDDTTTAKLWSLDGRLLQTFQHDSSVNSVAFSPNGQSILTGSWDSTAKLWSLDRRLLQAFQHKADVRSVAFSPDGQSILTGSDDHKAELWGVDGRLLHTFQHEASVLSVAFSPDGQSILTGSDDYTAELWGVNGRLLQTFQHKADVRSVAFSPDGQSILTGSWDSTAKLWGVDGRLLQTFQHKSPVLSVSFSPDGRSILTGSRDSTAKLWGVDGRLLQTFQHRGQVLSVAFSPDSQSILTGGGDAKLWSVDGQLLHTFQGRLLWSVSFSPDGKSILTGSGDKTAKLWSVDGRLLHTFQGHKADVRSVAFSPDGQSILTGSDDNTAKLWNLDLNASLSLMCDHLHDFAAGSRNPDLPAEERQLRERARTACEGIPPPKLSSLPSSQPKLSLLSGVQWLISTAQSLLHRL